MGGWTGSWQVWWDSSSPQIIFKLNFFIFLLSFLFPKPLLMFRSAGCGRWGSRYVMWILYDGCMGGVSCVFAGLGVTPLWLKRISRCTSCSCAHCQTARLNFDRFNSSHFFWKISMNHKFPFFLGQWSLLNLIIKAYFHICWWKISKISPLSFWMFPCGRRTISTLVSLYVLF